MNEDRSRGGCAAPGGASLGAAVRRCGGHGAFLAALGGIYRRADAAVAARGARCLGGGACCRFDLAGHRLYLSTGELALLSAAAPEVAPGGLRAGRCPYQVGPRCTARQRRPLGCRVFYCDPELGGFCADLYERLHRRIRRLHDRWAVPYAYVELTAGLSEVLAPPRPDAAFQGSNCSGFLR